MRLMNEIPDSFWSLFRSRNRDIYIEALLQINEEYEYSNYYLSREVCIQTLSDYFSRRKIVIVQEDMEDDFDMLEPPATRILNWLIRNQWLRKVDDYQGMTTNIVIPDYAAVMVEAFARLDGDGEDETQVYIQNVYAILFALKHDPCASFGMLKTALINTRKLNKTLQDMLHNMDKFFASLLEQKNYGDLLKEHLDGYVEELVHQKYHILKTSDNFYLYKNDSKQWIQAMLADPVWIDQLCARSKSGKVPVTPQDVVDNLDMIQRGFDDIEHRIANMDKEHSKYIRATVTRLNYLLNEEDNMKGLVIDLLNHLSASDQMEEDLKKVGEIMNLSQVNIVSDQSLYKKRKQRTDFAKNLEPDMEVEELTKDQILNMNRMKSRYSRKQIEMFLTERMSKGKVSTADMSIDSEEDFEKLILAYDFAIRKNSGFTVETVEGEVIDHGTFRYPKLTFTKKSSGTMTT